MAEAMAMENRSSRRGIPATSRSWTRRTACSSRTAPSGYRAGCEPYPVDAEWADPDLDVAARYLRDVWEAPDVARQLGARAREQILDRCSPERTAEFVATRLDELRDVRRERSAKALEQLVPGAPLIDPGGRSPARAVRRLLQRLLWPYLAEQLAFDAALADALRAQSMRTAVAASNGPTKASCCRTSARPPAAARRQPRCAGPRSFSSYPLFAVTAVLAAGSSCRRRRTART